MANARWREIYDRLREQIVSGELPPGSSLPTDQALAEQMGVSRLTAHRALYELQRSGYVARRRRAGTVVVSTKGESRATVSAVFFNVANPFESALLSALVAGLGDEVQLAVRDTRHHPERELEIIQRQARETDAIVLFPTCDPENSSELVALCESGFPLVCIDRFPHEVPCDAVLTDNYGATRRGLEMLLEMGHDRIAHFTDLEPHVASTTDRLRAYQDAMTEAGCDTSGLLRTFPYLTPDTHREYEQVVQMVHDALFALLHAPNPPTAVFCLRELYAVATVQACEMLGVRIAQDLEVLAFFDRPSVMMRNPEKINRIVQDIEEIGQIAARRVLARLAGEPLSPERILVPAKVVPRAGLDGLPGLHGKVASRTER